MSKLDLLIIETTLNTIWSSLRHFRQIWSNLIKNEMTIFILMINVTTLYVNIFLIGENSNLIKFDPFWTVLIQSDEKHNDNFFAMVNVTTFYSNIFLLVRTPIWSNLIHFNPFWTDLIQKY